MAEPAGWTSMTAVSIGRSSVSSTATINGTSATFSFIVSQQPTNNTSLIRFTLRGDIPSISYLIQDVTDYDALGNPKSVFTVNFTRALFQALRNLIGSSIPALGSTITYGASLVAALDSVDISLLDANNPHVFLAICQYKDASSSGSIETLSSRPRAAKVEQTAPWERPAEISFEASMQQGLTLGFAYPTLDLNGKAKVTPTDLRKGSLATSKTMVAVANYANDPFKSPPAFQTVGGTMRMSRAFLRTDPAFSITDATGKINSDKVSIKNSGINVEFDVGTLNISGISMSTKVYDMSVDWLPGTQHPLNKTFGDLFHGYSTEGANKVAINKTAEKITVVKSVRYIEVSAMFTYKPEGFGVWLANRGYKDKDGKPIYDDANDTMTETWLDKDGKPTKTERIWRGFTLFEQSDIVAKVMNEFLKERASDKKIAWATEDDGKLGRIK